MQLWYSQWLLIHLSLHITLICQYFQSIPSCVCSSAQKLCYWWWLWLLPFWWNSEVLNENIASFKQTDIKDRQAVIAVIIVATFSNRLWNLCDCNSIRKIWHIQQMWHVFRLINPNSGNAISLLMSSWRRKQEFAWNVAEFYFIVTDA